VGVTSREIRMPVMEPERLPPPRMNATLHGQVVSSPHIVHSGHVTHTAVLHDQIHGLVHVHTVPREGQKTAMPPYVIEPPDVLSVQLLRDPKRVPQPIDGQFLVRPMARSPSASTAPSTWPV